MFKNLIFWKKRKILNPLDFVSLDIIKNETELRLTRGNGEIIEIPIPKDGYMMLPSTEDKNVQ